MDELKRCSECGFECGYDVAAEHFDPDNTYDGYSDQCKQCASLREAAEQERMRSRLAAVRQKSHAIAAFEAAQAESQPSARIRAFRKYYATHKEQRRAYNFANRERFAAYGAAYRKTPRGQLAMKVSNHNRRMRMKAAGPRLSAGDIETILKAHTDSNGQLRCARCGQVISGRYHLDHFIPVKLGGTNDAGNFRVMHPKCNLSKHDSHPHRLGMLI